MIKIAIAWYELLIKMNSPLFLIPLQILYFANEHKLHQSTNSIYMSMMSEAFCWSISITLKPNLKKHIFSNFIIVYG